MGILRGKNAPPVTEPVVTVSPQSLIASAVRMTLSPEAWRSYRFTDEAWQKQAWDFYDTIPQLHQAVDYIGSASSLVRIYVAEVDEYGVRGAEVDNNRKVAALADKLFGGPAGKAEMLRSIGESLTVAGEVFILGRAGRGGEDDMWWTAAPSEVRPVGDIVYVNMGRATREELNPSRDMVIRAWTPHPRRFYLADSPVRGLLGLLTEMADMQLFLRSQLLSRIANASVLPVPSTLSVPQGDATSVADFYDQMMESLSANLEGRGTAAQIAPILWQMPLEELAVMANVRPIVFESPLSEQAIDLRKEQQEKLAMGMNVPSEIMLGGREMNHWSVWWASEEFIVKTIAPLFNRIVDALNMAFLYPALKVLGEDPYRYTYWYDTAPLANSANKLRDTIDLYNLGIVSAQAVREAGAYLESDAPSEEESNVRFVKELLLRDPTLFAAEQVREFIGIDEIDQTVPELATPPPPPPAPGRVTSESRTGELPSRPSNGDVADTIDGNSGDSDLIASAAPSVVHIAANGAVLRALELAGKRMLTPSTRNIWHDDVTILHTKYQLKSGEQMDKVLRGAWERLPQQMAGTGVTASAMQPLLDTYVKGLISRQIAHDPSLLSAYLKEAGIQ